MSDRRSEPSGPEARRQRDAGPRLGGAPALRAQPPGPDRRRASGARRPRRAPAAQAIPAALLRDDVPELPELSEIDVVRHFTRLSTWNAAVDLGPYPLGSCTMKYNPKLNERAARLPGFAGAHPLQPDALAQGLLALFHRLEGWLAEVSGMDRVSLQPAAGAQGELAGIMMIRAYHAAKRRPAAQGAGPRVRPRHEPRERGAERLRGGGGPGGRGRHPAPGDGGRRDGRRRGGADGDEPEHPRALRAPHRRDLRRRPRQGRPRLRRRRQPERHARRHAPRGPGHRRDALQPAQDLLDAPRRRRPGRRPGGREGAAGALPAGAPWCASAATAASSSAASCPAASAASTATTATWACWCAPTPTSAPSAPTACAAARRWRC